MSLQQAESFFEALKADPQLQQQISSESPESDKDNSALLEHLVKVGADSGYSFTVEEIQSVWKNYTDRKESDQLTEEQLQTIAGGCVLDTILGTFIGCG